VRFTEPELRKAISQSHSWAEALRRLGYRPAGGNPKTLKKYAVLWRISTAHFDPYASQRGRPNPNRIPLDEILVEGSTYHRAHLKRRLYANGLKKPICELCGQGEIWRGRTMSMILDHINGIHDDNRLENLRIVCPNCAATLATHCGRKNVRRRPDRECLRCGKSFRPRSPTHRYCSVECGTRWDRRGKPIPGARRAIRPPREDLREEVLRVGYSAVGRKHGVSDNAVRKWLLEYERERAIKEGRDPRVVEIPRRTWPNRRQNRKAA
jgi:hypothetical protein